MSAACKVVVMGNVVEVTWIDCKNDKCHAIKLDGKHWIDPETGEIHEYEKDSDKRTDNTQELLRTFATIRALVNTNCKDPKRIRWITLTYAENMTDTKRLKRDFNTFWKRFKRRWGDAEYISVIEPQGRGAWHVHLIAIWDGAAPFIPNAELRECWGHGFVKVNAVREDCDNLGAYLSAYLADIEVPSDGTEKQVDGQKKRFKKRGRLHMYPAHMQIYRTSRGIERPDTFWAEGAENWARYKGLTDGREPVFEREYAFQDDEGRDHHVVKQQYNLIRDTGDSGAAQGQTPSGEDSGACHDRNAPEIVPDGAQDARATDARTHAQADALRARPRDRGTGGMGAGWRDVGAVAPCLPPTVAACLPQPPLGGV